MSEEEFEELRAAVPAGGASRYIREAVLRALRDGMKADRMDTVERELEDLRRRLTALETVKREPRRETDLRSIPSLRSKA